MTLRDEIRARPDCAAAIAAKDIDAIAEIMSVGRVKTGSVIGGIGLIMDAVGPQAGAAFLDGLETAAAGNSAVKWGLYLIKDGTLDFGLKSTQDFIGLVGGPLTDALRAIANVPDPLSRIDVAEALFNDDGSEK
ncbi:MAG: hypothetical protein ACRYGK_03885 [Janthinobacterium lividum]